LRLLNSINCFKIHAKLEKDYRGKFGFFYIGYGASTGIPLPLSSDLKGGIGVSVGVLFDWGIPDSSVGGQAGYVSLSGSVNFLGNLDVGGGETFYVEQMSSRHRYLLGGLHPGEPRKADRAWLTSDIKMFPSSGPPSAGSFWLNPVGLVLRYIAIKNMQYYADIFDGIHFESYFPK
jgi:hypothetical protein